MKTILYRTMCFFIVFFSLNACSPSNVNTSASTQKQQYSQVVLKAADISSDGKFSLISNNQQVCLWNNQSNQKQYACLTGLETKYIELLGISKSNRYFFTSNRVNVHLYDLASGRLITVWSSGDNIINDIAMAEDDSTLIFGFRSGQASVVSVKTNQITTYQIHRLDINSVSLSADGKTAFTGSSDKTAKTWQTDSGEELASFTHQSRVNHVALSADAKTAFTLDAIKDRYFWQLDEGKQVSELQSNIRFIEFNDSTFSANNQLLFSASPRQKLQAWRVKDGELVGEWQASTAEQGGRASVINIVHTQAKEIATMTSDGVYQTWALSSGK